MFFKTLAPSEFDPAPIQRFIDLFDRRGWSGPHSFEGRLLSHVLNHCVTDDIPFTLMFVPKAGYYVKSAYPDNFVPAAIVASFKRELQRVREQTGEPLDEEVFGSLYDMETLPDTTSDAEDFAEVLEAATGPDASIEIIGDGLVRVQQKKV